MGLLEGMRTAIVYHYGELGVGPGESFRTIRSDGTTKTGVLNLIWITTII